MQWCRWLTHRVVSRKLVGSISDWVNDIFINLILPAALWPWSISWGGGGGVEAAAALG